jgi:hypothetical protein
VGTLVQTFPFEEIRFHKESAIRMKNSYINRNLFSLNQVKMMWTDAKINFDLIMYIRLNVLPTSPLSPAEIGMMMDTFHDSRIFIPFEISPQIDQYLIIGNPAVMSIYGDNEGSIIELCRHKEITICRIMLYLVRIKSDATIDEMDTDTCPYLDDLLFSSSLSRGLGGDRDAHNKSQKT